MRSSSDEAPVSLLTPARRRGAEILDDPSVDPAVRKRSLDDVERSNKLLGGLRAALIEVRAARHDLGRPLTLLDVGTGLADIPQRAAAEARRAGIALTTIAVDDACSLLAASRERVEHAVCARALALPFPDASVDVVLCSQLMHHFDEDGVRRLIREIDRVARHAVIVSDLRRSWIAAAGFWLVSVLLRFSPVTRHDGTLSVLRGFTTAELARLVGSETGVAPVVRRRLGFRLTARWTPGVGARIA
jgi:ubiquinone/menaquinone biosynthesis C-methylase UbiE